MGRQLSAAAGAFLEGAERPEGEPRHGHGRVARAAERDAAGDRDALRARDERHAGGGHLVGDHDGRGAGEAPGRPLGRGPDELPELDGRAGGAARARECEPIGRAVVRTRRGGEAGAVGSLGASPVDVGDQLVGGALAEPDPARTEPRTALG